MVEKLRDQLIGAWTLVLYVETPVNGGPSNHPMGNGPIGIIMYTPDGYMSAQLMRPNRTPFASSDWYKATPEEYGREGPAYFAYSGLFQVDEENATVTHSVLVSLFPNWIGGTQTRVARGRWRHALPQHSLTNSVRRTESECIFAMATCPSVRLSKYPALTYVRFRC
jgi:hypothetical protein